MQLEFDPGKDLANQIKHGLSLTAAAHMDLSRAVTIEDSRFNYGEVRYISYAPLNGRLHVLWYTRRGEVIRAIGLRKANNREKKRFDQAS